MIYVLTIPEFCFTVRPSPSIYLSNKVSPDQTSWKGNITTK